MIFLNLNDLYKHPRGNHESNVLQIWYSFKINCQVADGQYVAARNWAPGGECIASTVGRAEQVPPSVSPSDAALPPTAETRTTGRSSERDEPHFGTRSVHLLRWVNRTARRIQMPWRIQRASSMCWATSEVPWFFSKNALHRSHLTSQNTGNTPITHLRSCLIRMI